MNFNSEEKRTAQLNAILTPELKDGKGKKLLYVGGHLRFGRNLQISDYLLKAGYQIDVIEIFPDNVIQLNNVQWIHRVIEGDIRYFDPMIKYDLTVFWHGPEHLERDEVPVLLEKMKTYSKAIIFATPNGEYDQGEEYGNPAEIHKAAWYKDQFEVLGMTVSAIGEPDQKNGNIIALWTEQS